MGEFHYEIEAFEKSQLKRPLQVISRYCKHLIQLNMKHAKQLRYHTAVAFSATCDVKRMTATHRRILPSRNGKSLMGGVIDRYQNFLSVQALYQRDFPVCWICILAGLYAVFCERDEVWKCVFVG